MHVDHRAAKDPERKDNRGDNHKTDTQKSSWRKESWRNGNKATEKQQQQEPRPEPETWRKPVEQSNPAPSDGLRYGKAASALELAQAFSRSVSTNPKTPDRISSQKGMAGQPQIPFSRLTATTTTTATREIYSGRTPRRQINGYWNDPSVTSNRFVTVFSLNVFIGLMQLNNFFFYGKQKCHCRVRVYMWIVESQDSVWWISFQLTEPYYC